jgi:hypothetical protein
MTASPVKRERGEEERYDAYMGIGQKEECIA